MKTIDIIKAIETEYEVIDNEVIYCKNQCRDGKELDKCIFHKFDFGIKHRNTHCGFNAFVLYKEYMKLKTEYKKERKGILDEIQLI